MTGLALAWRLARRELRGGLKGFRIFFLCLLLGTAAIAGVECLSDAFLTGLRDSGQTLLGGDVAVFPGDVVLGDAEGVVIIPAALADEVADEAVEMTAFEDFVTEQVMDGRTIVGLYPATNEQTLVDFKAWRERLGR